MKPISKLPLRFSVVDLLADLRAVTNTTWTPIIQKGEQIGWNGAALRSHDGNAATMSYLGESYQDTPLLHKVPYIRNVLSNFECDLLRVRLLALHPGTVIPEHTDKVPERAAPQVRLHLPIVTNDQVSFLVAGEALRMQPGELWYVDVTLPHSVANRGDSTRVHLVIDCILNDWLRGMVGNSS